MLAAQGGQTPLHVVAEGGQTEVVRTLLGAGARVDATTKVSMHDRLGAGAVVCMTDWAQHCGVHDRLGAGAAACMTDWVQRCGAHDRLCAELRVHNRQGAALCVHDWLGAALWCA
jgi:hypothetical protein